MKNFIVLLAFLVVVSACNKNDAPAPSQICDNYVNVSNFKSDCPNINGSYQNAPNDQEITITAYDTSSTVKQFIAIYIDKAHLGINNIDSTVATYVDYGVKSSSHSMNDNVYFAHSGTITIKSLTNNYIVGSFNCETTNNLDGTAKTNSGTFKVLLK